MLVSGLRHACRDHGLLWRIAWRDLAPSLGFAPPSATSAGLGWERASLEHDGDPQSDIDVTRADSR